MAEKEVIPLTVIVPMYNVAPYIERCARSLMEQNVDGMEVIFIDDCSPDDSAEKIEKIFSKKVENQRFSTRIVRMSANAGLAGVRRQGINQARGQYIIHLDGDDWVDPGYYRALLDKAMETGADIVVGDEVEEFSTGPIPKVISDIPADGRRIMQQWYRDTLGLHCHNKLVRRSLYTDNAILPYVGLNMWEDNALFARLFYYAGKVARVTGPVYHYNRMNESAMTAGYGSKQVEQMIEVARRLGDFFDSIPDADDFKKTSAAFKYLAKLNLLTDSMEGYRRFKTLFPESNFIAKELDLNAFSAKGRLRFRMARMGLGSIFVALFSLYKRIRG